MLAGLNVQKQLDNLQRQLHGLQNLPESVALIMNAIGDILLPAVHGLKVRTFGDFLIFFSHWRLANTLSLQQLRF